MSPVHATLVSLGVCAVAAALEGACAGQEVKSYFAKLTSPPYSPPMWVWYIIGGLYYGTFFFVVYRILTRGNNSSLAEGTFALVLAMLLGNGLWNYLFFRARKLFMSVLVTFLAPVMDLVLLICLIKLDRVAARALMPYLIYRVYSVWWAYRLWRLNPEVG
jgi:tryptophan-rich sensory protein